jgi:hypothetical protein
MTLSQGDWQPSTQRWFILRSGYSPWGLAALGSAAIMSLIAVGMPAEARASRVEAWTPPVEAALESRPSEASGEPLSQFAAEAAAFGSQEPLPLQLRCVPEGEKFICDAVDEAAWADLDTTDGIVATVTPTPPPALLSDTRRNEVANLVLAIALVGGGGIGLSFWLQRRRATEDVSLLKYQVEMLERIWDKSTSS